MSLVANPIIPGCHPDPSICRVGDYYYLVTSTFEYFPGLPIYRSTDLAHWEQVGSVVSRAGQLDFDGIASSGGLYAPTLRHHDGMFWLVCTLVDRQDSARGGSFLMTSPDPAGPWSDPTWLGVDGIDPSLFFDDDGRVWMHGTRLAQNPRWHDQTEVWVREYDPDAHELVGQEHVIWSGALNGAVWAEGPHIYKIDGTYFLVAAEGRTEFAHAVSVARSASVVGPYVGNPANPVLTHRNLGRAAAVVGVGHADLVQAVDGSWWAVLLAMRADGGRHYMLGRETFLAPVTWEDGWPVFCAGIGRVPEAVNVPFGAEPRRPAIQNTDPALIRSTDLRWTSLRRPAAEFATRVGDGWRIHPTSTSMTEPGTPAFLGVRQQHMKVDVAATFTVSLVDGDEAGIIVRQSEQDQLRLALSAAGATRLAVEGIHRRAGAESVLGTREISIQAGQPVVLGLHIRERDYVLTVRTGGDPEVMVASADGGMLDSATVGGFLGLWLGVYATSMHPGSAADVGIERFEYSPA